MLFWEGCEAEQEKEGLEGLRCRECDSLKKRQFTAAIALTSLITFFFGLVVSSAFDVDKSFCTCCQLF